MKTKGNAPTTGVAPHPRWDGKRFGVRSILDIKMSGGKATLYKVRWTTAPKTTWNDAGLTEEGAAETVKKFLKRKKIQLKMDRVTAVGEVNGQVVVTVAFAGFSDFLTEQYTFYEFLQLDNATSRNRHLFTKFLDTVMEKTAEGTPNGSPKEGALASNNQQGGFSGDGGDKTRVQHQETSAQSNPQSGSSISLRLQPSRPKGPPPALIPVSWLGPGNPVPNQTQRKAPFSLDGGVLSKLKRSLDEKKQRGPRPSSGEEAASKEQDLAGPVPSSSKQAMGDLTRRQQREPRKLARNGKCGRRSPTPFPDRRITEPYESSDKGVAGASPCSRKSSLPRQPSHASGIMEHDNPFSFTGRQEKSRYVKLPLLGLGDGSEESDSD